MRLNADTDIAQLQSLQAAAELAQTVYERDRAQYEIKAIAKAQLDADAADLKSKKAQVAQQTALIAKKTIRAPFAGRLGITTVNPGQYLNPGDAIVTLQAIDPIYADFYLPQQQLGQLAVGQVVGRRYQCLRRPHVRRPDPVDQPARGQRHAQHPDRSHRGQPRTRAAAGHVRQRQDRCGRGRAPSDAAANGHHVQPVRRDGVRREAGNEARRAGQDAARRAAGVRDAGRDARRSGRDTEGRRRKARRS